MSVHCRQLSRTNQKLEQLADEIPNRIEKHAFHTTFTGKPLIPWTNFICAISRESQTNRKDRDPSGNPQSFVGFRTEKIHFVS